MDRRSRVGIWNTIYCFIVTFYVELWPASDETGWKTVKPGKSFVTGNFLTYPLSDSNPLCFGVLTHAVWRVGERVFCLSMCR